MVSFELRAGLCGILYFQQRYTKKYIGNLWFLLLKKQVIQYGGLDILTKCEYDTGIGIFKDAINLSKEL